MPQKPKGDRLWLVLCTSTGVVVDLTLNKYSSQLPGVVVLFLWLIPTILFFTWLWRVERTHGWIRSRFFEHPVSYVAMILVLIPFAWQATATVFAKLGASGYWQEKATAQSPISLPPKIEQPSSKQGQASEAQSTEIPSPGHQSVTSSPRSKATPKKDLRLPAPSGQANADPDRAASATAPLPSSTAQPATYGTQTCIGACAQGEGSSATFNQYGASLPAPHVTIVYNKGIPGASSQDQTLEFEPQYRKNPGVDLVITPDENFQDAIFFVTCDRPCFVNFAQVRGQVFSIRTLGRKYPTQHGVRVGTMGPLLKGNMVNIRVRSDDDQPISVLKVEGYAEPDRQMVK